MDTEAKVTETSEAPIVEASEDLESCPECGQAMPEEEEAKAAEAEPEKDDEEDDAEEEASVTAKRLEAIEAKVSELVAAIEKLSKPKATGTSPVGFGGDREASGAKDFMALVMEYDAAHKCGIVKAMSHVTKANPEAHKRYISKA